MDESSDSTSSLHISDAPKEVCAPSMDTNGSNAQSEKGKSIDEKKELRMDSMEKDQNESAIEDQQMISQTEPEDIDFLLSSLTITENEQRLMDENRMNQLTRDQKIKLLERICMLREDANEPHNLILNYLVSFAIQECNRVLVTENETETLFECLSLLTMNHPKLIYPHLPILISFFCQIVRLSLLNCRRAMNLITVLYESHPHLIPEEQMEEILLCSLFLEEPKGETSEWLAMDSLDLPIKPAQWFGLIYESLKINERNGDSYVNVMVNLFKNRDWKKRYCGVLGSFTDGGYRRELKKKYIAGEMEDAQDAVATTQLLLGFINDEHPRIRSLVCQTIEHMATVYAGFFQIATHETVVPSLLATLRDDSSRVAGHAAHTLAIFFRCCPAFIASPLYINIFQMALDMAHNSFLLENKSLLIHEIVSLISVVTRLHLKVSMCTCRQDCGHDQDHQEERKEKPKFDELFFKLKLILKHCPKLSKLTRVTIFQCIAYIGEMIGKEKFSVEDTCDILRSILPLISSLNPLDPECSLILDPLYLILANLDTNSLSTLLPELLPPIISMASIQVFDEETGNLKINVPLKEVMNMKKWACMILKIVASDLRVSFIPYVEEVSKAMIDNLKWFDRHKCGDLIESSFSILPILLSSMNEGGVPSRLSLWAQYWMSMKGVMKTRMGTYLTDHCIKSVSDCIENLSPEDLNEEQLREVGDIIKEKLEDILLREELKWTVEEMERPSYTIEFKDEEEEESEKDQKTESALLDSVSYLFSAVIEKGHSCNYMIDSVIPLVFSLIDRYDDKEWGISILARIIQHSPHSGINYHLKISDLFFKSISHDDPGIRHEAAFSFGEMALSGIPEWMRVASQSISSLSSMIDRPDSRSTDDSILATENAISSITKIITNCEVEEGTVNNILSRFIDWLPISEDEEEAQFVYRFLADLIEEKNGVILGEGNVNSPKIFCILTKVVNDGILDSTPESLLVKERLVNIIKEMQYDEKSMDV